MRLVDPGAMGEGPARTQGAPISGISGRPRTQPGAAQRGRATQSLTLRRVLTKILRRCLAWNPAGGACRTEENAVFFDRKGSHAETSTALARGFRRDARGRRERERR